MSASQQLGSPAVPQSTRVTRVRARENGHVDVADPGPDERQPQVPETGAQLEDGDLCQGRSSGCPGVGPTMRSMLLVAGHQKSNNHLIVSDTPGGGADDPERAIPGRADRPERQGRDRHRSRAGSRIEVASRLAEAGAAVAVNDLDEARGRAKPSSRSLGPPVAAPRWPAGDASQRVGAEVAAPAALDAHGRVDILVNNAGIWPMSPFLEADDSPLVEDARSQPDRHTCSARRSSLASWSSRARAARSSNRLDRRGRAASRTGSWHTGPARQASSTRRGRSRSPWRHRKDSGQCCPAGGHGDAGRDEHPAPWWNGHPARPSRPPGRGRARGPVPRERPGLLRDRRSSSRWTAAPSSSSVSASSSA